MMKRLLALLLGLLLLASTMAVAEVATDTDLDTVPELSGPETPAEEPEAPAGEPEEDAPVLQDADYYLTRSVKEAALSLHFTVNGTRYARNVELAELDVTGKDELAVVAEVAVPNASMIEASDLSNLSVGFRTGACRDVVYCPLASLTYDSVNDTWVGTATLAFDPWGSDMDEYYIQAWLRDDQLGVESEASTCPYFVSDYRALDFFDGYVLPDSWGSGVSFTMPNRGVSLDYRIVDVSQGLVVASGTAGCAESVFVKLYPGDFALSLSQEGMESWTKAVTFTVLDEFAAPTLTVTQTDANTVKVVLVQNTANYCYDVSHSGTHYTGTGKATRQTGGTYKATLTFSDVLPTEGAFDITAWPVVDAEDGSLATASVPLACDWGWHAAPKVAVAQDPLAEHTLNLTVTLPWTGELSDIGDGFDLSYEVRDDIGRLTTLSYADADENGVITCALEWYSDSGTKSTTFTVTPRLDYDAGESTFTVYGNAGSVKYNSTRFLDDQWAVAPTLTLKDTGLGYGVLTIGYTGAPTQLWVYVDDIWIGNAADVFPVLESSQGSLTVALLQESSSVLIVGKKGTVTVTPVLITLEDTTRGNSTSKTITLSSAPAWATKTLKITASQVDDERVKLSWATPSGAALSYDIYDNAVQIADEDMSISVSGKNTVAVVASEADSASHTYTVIPHLQSVMTGSDTYGKASTVTIKALKPQWKTKPTVKVSVNANAMTMTVKVTYKGTPDSIRVEFSPDGKKNWDAWTPDDQTEMADGTVTFTYSLSSASAGYVRAIPEKDGADGKTSAKVKYKLSPRWATYKLGLSAAQVGENVVKLSWKKLTLTSAEATALGAGADAVTYMISGVGPQGEDITEAIDSNVSSYLLTLPEGSDYGKYTFSINAVIDGGGNSYEGAVSTAKVTMKKLCLTAPVIKGVSFDLAGNASVTFTYYGLPEGVAATFTLPNGLTVSADLFGQDDPIEDAGPSGLKVTKTVNLSTDVIFGTYSLKLTVSDGEGGTKSCKAKKYTNSNAFLSGKPVIKTVAQYTETRAKITLKKQLTQLSDMTGYYLMLTRVDTAEVTLLDPATTSFMLDGLSVGSTAFTLVPVYDDGEGYLIVATPVSFTVTMVKDYWNRTTPTFTVEQYADTQVSVKLTRGYADQYLVQLVDAYGDQTSMYVSRDSTCMLTAGCYGECTVNVWPVNPNTGVVESRLVASKTLVLTQVWDTIGSVTVKKTGKLDSRVTVTFSYNAVPDGVILKAYAIGSGDAIFSADVQLTDMTVSTTKKTCSFTVWTGLTGTYVFTVTPYIVPQEDTGSIAVGTSVTSNSLSMSLGTWASGKPTFKAVIGEDEDGNAALQLSSIVLPKAARSTGFYAVVTVVDEYGNYVYVGSYDAPALVDEPTLTAALDTSVFSGSVLYVNMTIQRTCDGGVDEGSTTTVRAYLAAAGDGE